MPNRERYQRAKRRRQEALEFEDLIGPGPVPDYLVTLWVAGSNADLQCDKARDFGQRSDRTKFSLRNKKNHDDAVARREQFDQAYRELIIDDSKSCTGVAQRIKVINKQDLRKVETIAKRVQEARRRMRA